MSGSENVLAELAGGEVELVLDIRAYQGGQKGGVLARFWRGFGALIL
jgi:hypothetical protein